MPAGLGSTQGCAPKPLGACLVEEEVVSDREGAVGGMASFQSEARRDLSKFRSSILAEKFANCSC